jgi:hypothetical protein
MRDPSTFRSSRAGAPGGVSADGHRARGWKSPPPASRRLAVRSTADRSGAALRFHPGLPPRGWRPGGPPPQTTMARVFRRDRLRRASSLETSGSSASRGKQAMPTASARTPRSRSPRRARANRPPARSAGLRNRGFAPAHDRRQGPERIDQRNAMANEANAPLRSREQEKQERDEQDASVVSALSATAADAARCARGSRCAPRRRVDA